MLSEQPFYFHTFRNLVVAFGDLLNNVQTTKSDEDGNIIKQLTVPIAFARRQKYLARLREDVTKNHPDSPAVEITLPRMSYDITSIDPDASRKLSSLTQQRRNVVENGVEKYLHQLSGNPFNANIELTIYTYSLDEMLQIIEQILPYFTPDFNLKILDIPELDIKKNVPIVLTGVSPSDEFTGTMMDDFRIIEWTLSFETSFYFYPPIKEGNVIRRVITNIQQDETTPAEQITTQEVDPFDAQSTDNYDVTKTIVENS